jgi:hypothetical protein
LLRRENKDGLSREFFKEENMKSLQSFLGTVAKKTHSKAPHLARLLATSALAFGLFGSAALVSAGTALASPAATCGDQVKASETIYNYNGSGNNATLNLVKNTCTGLFHAQIVCTLPSALVGSEIFIMYGDGNGGTYNTSPTQTCSQVGQVFNGEPIAYRQSEQFCAHGFAENLATRDGSNAYACVTAP